MLFLTQSSNLFFEADEHRFFVHSGHLDYLQNSNELKQRLYDGSNNDFIKLRFTSNSVAINVDMIPAYPTCNIGTPNTAWKTAYLSKEGMEIKDTTISYHPTSNSFQLNTDIHFMSNVYVSGIPLIPVGTIFPYAGLVTPPADYVWCNGATYSRTVYNKLFQVIGTTYGEGDGFSTFNVPNLQRRTPMGAGGGAGLTNRTLGESAGQSNIVLSINELPPHTHTKTHVPSSSTNICMVKRSLTGIGTATTYKNTVMQDPQYADLSGIAPDLTAVPYGFTATTNNRGGLDPLNLLHSYCVIPYIIKYQ